MYWQYKVILVVILLIIALGLGFLIWRSLPEGVSGALTAASQAEETSEAATSPTDAARPGAAAANDAARAPTPTRDNQPASTRDNQPATRPHGAPRPAAPSGNPTQAETRLATAEQQFRQDNLLAARELATLALDDPAVVEFDRLWFRGAQLISEINTVFMNSAAPSPEKTAYTVQPGDSLSRIAARHNTTIGALQRLNDMDPTNPVIYPGSVLYLLQGDWSLRAVRTQFVLLLMHGDRLFKMYRVGIGRQNRTPIGRFTITSKVIHPAWTPPGKNIPFGDPENVLGTHWLGLTPSEGTSPTLKGYGIHGTWEPETVGTAASAGCIRMTNDEVAELFDFIPMPSRTGPQVQVVIED